MLIQIPFLTTPDAQYRSERRLHLQGSESSGAMPFPLATNHTVTVTKVAKQTTLSDYF